MPGTTKAELFVWRGEEARPHPNQSVAQYVLERLKKHAREATFPAQVMATTGSKMSFRELLRRSVRSADAWRSAGLGPGRVVAVFAKNSEALFPAVMGALFQGVTFTAINHMSTEAELRHCLSLVQPDAILCDPSNAEMAQRVADKSLIVIQDGPVPKGCRAKTLEEVLAAAASDLDVDAYEPVDVGNLKEHVAVIVFSSGSTGLPKAVMISNRSIVQSFLDGVDTFRCVYKERMMISSPMSWITGIGLLLHCTMRGTTRICDNFTTAAAMLANLRKYEANCWFTAAPLLKMVVEAAKSEGGDGTTPPCPSLRAVVVGGTAMSISMHEGLSRELQCEIFQAYASTEMLACATTRKQMRLGSAGQLLGGIHARLVDAETGAEIRAAGQVGELRIYSQYLMLGYKDDPEATAEALDEHGYFRSGDLASFDEDGFLYIVGRVKDQLKFRAHQVAPLEIEAVLLSHPGVGEACVVGRPHPNCGDVPAACVARRPGREEVTEAELLKLVASQLSDAKRLRGGIVFAKQIPKNSNGKVARRDVLALFEGIPMQDVD